MTTPYQQYAVWGHVACGAWSAYLGWRQAVAHCPNRPQTDATRAARAAFGLTDDAAFRRTQEYNQTKFRLGVWRGVFSTAVAAARAGTTAMPALFRATARLTGAAPGSFWHQLAFDAAADVLETLLAAPWEYYATFVVEERFGFNKTTLREFIKDRVKSLLLSVCVLNPAVSTLVNFTVRRWGAAFPAYLFGGGSALIVAFMFLFPVVIQPLFNKFSPLPDGSLRARIEAAARSLSFPLKRIYTMDGSRRSAHSNAYMYGFYGSKRVVLFDTLLQQMDEDEVMAVLWHEFGHWHHSHTLAFFGCSLAQVAALCYGARAVMFDPAVYRAFGFPPPESAGGASPPAVGFMCYSHFLAPLMMGLSMGLSAVSRRFEFQADRFAVARTDDRGASMKRALAKLQKENLGSVTPDWLYAACHYSHPPLPERLAAIDAEMKKEA